MNSELRVLHVTESHSKAAGGVTAVVNDLARNIKFLGGGAIVLAASGERETTPVGVDYFSLGAKSISPLSFFSTSLRKKIKEIIISNKINVIHLHGFWLPPQLIAARLAKEMGIPFVMTTHGMLQPWMWRGKGWKGLLKKTVYFHLAGYHAFRKSNIIHAITPMEANNLEQLFPKRECIVVPNAIEMATDKICVKVKYERTIFFIGRIHPVKGVHTLLEAFKASNLPQQWNVVIAGPEEDSSYAMGLRDFVKTSGLEGRVSFIGQVYGKEKEYWFRNSWVTVVPSYSEVIGMVNLEAAAASCPSITTYGTGLWDWEKGGGVLIEPQVEELTLALKDVAAWDEDTRRIKGRESYTLVKNNYEWSLIGEKWMKLYKRLLNN